jgi:hypothetical protein
MRGFQAIGLTMALLGAGVVCGQAQEEAAEQEANHAAESAVEIPTANTAAVARPTPGSFGEVVDRMVEKEHRLVAQMRNLRPMVETYLQNLKNDAESNTIPAHDEYFLGRLDMSEGPEDVSFLSEPGARGRLNRLASLFSMHFQPKGFAQMVVLDSDLYKNYYNFTYVRREFLGEVRCIVIDAQPKADAPPGRFEGRIWVEDRDFNIVRFNGTYSGHHTNAFYMHFDSWRLNLRPGMWLPAYVYSEESATDPGSGGFHAKAQTRLWGYDLNAAGKNRNEEFTQIQMDPEQVAAQQIKDQTDAEADASPVAAERMWEKQAEDNVIERLENVGLLAPAGDVDAVLERVVNNLLISNNLALQSDVHCRVLITAPLESFTIGHTIVLSRGLLDVLPDETALAMVLAHELSHILLGHHSDSKLAFNDRMFFPDEQSFQRLDFRRRPVDEDAADARALELLKHSPYKEKLATAGLFLRALQQRAPELPNLIRPHLGNSFAVGTNMRMEALLDSAPQLDAQRIDQIAALPLGARIKLDPWTDQVELAKARPVTLALSREKMPFEITPFFPYLTRAAGERGEKVASAGSGSK